MPRARKSRKTKKVAKKSAEKAVNKTTLILSHAPGTSAAEIVKAAAAKGIKLSEKYVYTIRSNARRKAKRAERWPGRRARAVPVAASSSESMFRETVLALGTTRAKELLAEVERKLQLIIDGS
jgi:hypothetical protein